MQNISDANGSGGKSFSPEPFFFALLQNHVATEGTENTEKSKNRTHLLCVLGVLCGKTLLALRLEEGREPRAFPSIRPNVASITLLCSASRRLRVRSSLRRDRARFAARREPRPTAV